MKRTVAALVMAVGFAVATAQAGEGWLTDLDKAKAQAKELNRPILVDFSGSDWCGWCIKSRQGGFFRARVQGLCKGEFGATAAGFSQEKKLACSGSKSQ